MSIELVTLSNYLILYHAHLLSPSVLPSIRVFSNESTLLMRWPRYWSFSFSIIPTKEHPGLISIWMDWLGLLALQGTLRSLLQHQSSKASILQCSAFFTVQYCFQSGHLRSWRLWVWHPIHPYLPKSPVFQHDLTDERNNNHALWILKPLTSWCRGGRVQMVSVLS